MGFPVMSFAGDKRVFYCYMVLLLVVPVIQIWVCHDCKVGAARSFPGTESDVVLKGKKSKEELFNRFFGGRDLNFSSTAVKGFEESKRKVPSCPDPLHN